MDDEQDIPRPPPANSRDRQTSFGRDFYSAGTDPSALIMMADIGEDDDEADEELPDSVVIPPSRPMGRRASTRVLMRNSVTRMSSRSLLQSNLNAGVRPVPQLPAMEGDIVSSTETRQFRRASRQPSWYRELLEQGVSQEDLAAIVGDPDLVIGDERGEEAQANANDEVVAEQHRFLALIEAKKRVQERLGYDPDERRQQMKQAPPPTERTRPCPLPTLRATNWKPTKDFPYSVPPKEIPIYSERFIRQRLPRQPELQTGQVGNSAGPGQMLVRCLGCKSNLRVSTHATLVACEQCSIVCPASSTRK